MPPFLQAVLPFSAHKIKVNCSKRQWQRPLFLVLERGHRRRKNVLLRRDRPSFSFPPPCPAGQHEKEWEPSCFLLLHWSCFGRRGQLSRGTQSLPSSLHSCWNRKLGVEDEGGTAFGGDCLGLGWGRVSCDSTNPRRKSERPSLRHPRCDPLFLLAASASSHTSIQHSPFPLFFMCTGGT